MKELLTTKQVAQALGVSDASLKRWCDKGLLSAQRTGGGHRRLPLSGVLVFLREHGYPLLRPELLGLPTNTGRGELAIDRAIEKMQSALESGDDEQFRRAGYNLYLSGTKLVEICDRVIVPIFNNLGTRWQHGDLEIYQERRGCEICLRWLHEMRFAIPPTPEDAPRAIGATLSGDLYWIPSTIVELILREAGWRADSLGIGLPGETVAAAIADHQPRMAWISASHIESEEAFLGHYRHVEQAAAKHRTALVVGGRALGEPIRRQMSYGAFGDSFQHVVNFAATLHAPAAGPAADSIAPARDAG